MISKKFIKDIFQKSTSLKRSAEFWKISLKGKVRSILWSRMVLVLFLKGLTVKGSTDYSTTKWLFRKALTCLLDKTLNSYGGRKPQKTVGRKDGPTYGQKGIATKFSTYLVAVSLRNHDVRLYLTPKANARHVQTEKVRSILEAEEGRHRCASYC